MKRVKVIFTAMMLCIAVAMPSNAYAADAEDWASLEGWLSSINGKLGYIYADTTNIYTALSVVKDTATTISTNVTNIKSSVDDITDDLAYLPAISSTVTNINTYTSGIYTRLGNLSTIKDIIDSHTTLLTTINNNINNVWADVQTIRDTSGYIYSSVSSISTYASDINTNLITVGETLDNVYSRLGNLNTNLSTIANYISRTQYYVTTDSGNRIWYDKVMPYNPQDVGALTGMVRRLDSYLTSSTSNFGSILTELQSIDDGIAGISIPDYTSSINDLITAVGNVNTNLASIADYVSRTQYYVTTDSGNRIWYDKVMPYNPQDIGQITGLVRRLDQYMVNVMNTVPDGLSDIWAMCQAIYEKISIPADSSQIIGDFDTDALDEEILDLKSVMSQVAPFGAITLVSAEFSILSSVAPVDYPQFVFPFDFGGFDQTLVLDLSWLEQAKGFINFFSMFMLIYCLTIWSIKFIKE